MQNNSTSNQETKPSTAGVSPHPANEVSQVRGAALREKMIESEKKGEEFRVQNQGRDVIDETVRSVKDER